jgi:CpXC protein
MSTFVPTAVDCPQCRASLIVDVARAVHATRLPRARAEIMDGTFQVQRCNTCGHRFRVESPFLYADFTRKHWVTVASQAGAPQQAKLRHERLIGHVVTSGPSIVRELWCGVTSRVVFGIDALREKLLVWNEGHADADVETAKHRLLVERGIEPATCEYRIDARLATVFVARRRRGDLTLPEIIAIADDEIAAARAGGWIRVGDGTIVDAHVETTASWVR